MSSTRSREASARACDDLDALLGTFRFEGLQPLLAVGVGVADEAHALDAVLLHVADHGVGHDAVAEWTRARAAVVQAGRRRTVTTTKIDQLQGLFDAT